MAMTYGVDDEAKIKAIRITCAKAQEMAASEACFKTTREIQLECAEAYDFARYLAFECYLDSARNEQLIAQELSAIERMSRGLIETRTGF